MNFVIYMKIKESETMGKYMDLAKDLKKTAEHESDGDTNWNDP